MEREDGGRPGDDDLAQKLRRRRQQSESFCVKRACTRDGTVIIALGGGFVGFANHA